MSSMKYDGYSDFRAGIRFLESLVSWLRHFDAADRPAAYDFVKKRLVYLIDDFTASGTRFIRFPEGKPKGKLYKFEKMVQDASERLKGDFPLAPGHMLHIHHHVSTTQAHDALVAQILEAKEKLPAGAGAKQSSPRACYCRTI
jgi:hypothetical protein